MRDLKTVLTEAMAVTGSGFLLALSLNALSPRGLNLSRDYFPGAISSSRISPSVGLPVSIGATNTAATAVADAALARLRAKDLRVVDHAQMVELFRDSRYPQGQIVFVDARATAQYQAGHIPGAYQFDHYRAPDYLATVLPPCLTAEQVIVYCLGGDCEDSEFAAVILRQSGIANERLAVYAGGFTEWRTNGLPVEIGVRGSGMVQEVNR